jgi:hypothetical protein
VLALDEVVDHPAAERTRSIQGYQGDDILEDGRPEFAQDIAQALAFELEDAERAGLAQQLIGPSIIERDIFQGDLGPMGVSDKPQGVVQHGERAQS